MGLSTVEIRVPDTQETSNSRDVLLQWRLSEVLVHRLRTSEELVEVVVANEKGHTEPDGTPDTISAANPALKSEHVLGINSKLGDL